MRSNFIKQSRILFIKQIAKIITDIIYILSDRIFLMGSSFKLFILFVIIDAFGVLGEDCNSTHFQFFSKFSLGKQDELNKTFGILQEQTEINNLSFKVSAFDNFNLTNIKLSFKYLDSAQRAQIVGLDTVMILGGKLLLTVSFNWNKYGLSVPKNGTATAVITSDQLLFEKKVELQSGFFDYILKDFYNVTFRSNDFELSRIDPPTTASQDIDYLKQILNTPIDSEKTSFKDTLAAAINKNYAIVLAINLKSEHFDLLKDFVYQWKNPNTNQTTLFNYSMFGTGVSLNKDGLRMTYVSRLKDFDGWECGSMVPTNPQNPAVYGGLQEFIEFSVFQNTMRSAFTNQILDTELTRLNWQTKFFQFFVGDLYEVFPGLATKFYASEPINGKCAYNTAKKPQIQRFEDGIMKVTSDHYCYLKVGNTTIVQFDILLASLVQIQPTNSFLNFKITNAAGETTFKQSPDFEMKNKELALLMVNSSLKRLMEGYTFGSGWKIFPRDYPHVAVQSDSIFIYDSTHIDNSQLRKLSTD